MITIVSRQTCEDTVKHFSKDLLFWHLQHKCQSSQLIPFENWSTSFYKLVIKWKPICLKQYKEHIFSVEIYISRIEHTYSGHAGSRFLDWTLDQFAWLTGDVLLTDSWQDNTGLPLSGFLNVQYVWPLQEFYIAGLLIGKKMSFFMFCSTLREMSNGEKQYKEHIFFCWDLHFKNRAYVTQVTQEVDF